ncbi:recombinase family protein [Micromonospora sp. NPDC005161]
MIRWCLYLRLSVSDDASTSIARQRADLEARAAREGGEVVAVLVDDGLSGGRRRARAEQALAMLADGSADVLAVWDLARWTRQGLAGLPDLLRVLDERPAARFIADRDNLDSASPTWDLHVGLLAGIAKAERANTQRRVTSSIAALRRAGRWAGGVVPWCYRPAPNPNGPGRVLVVDQAEKALAVEVADRILAGESYWRLARELNARSVPAPRSERRRNAQAGREGGDVGQWTASGLKNVLTSDTLLGRQTHKGRLLVGDDGLPLPVWPAALDADRWHRLRATLKPREARPQRRRAARLLSGLAACGECGSPLYVKAHASSRGGALYECASHWRGRADCPGVRIAAGSLEEYVAGRVLDLVGDWPLTRAEEVVADQGGATLAEVERAIRATTADLAEDGADEAELLGRLAALKARRAEVRALPEVREVREVPTGLTYGQAFKAAEGNLDGQRDLLGGIILGVRVHKATGNNGKFDPRRVEIDGPEGVFADEAAVTRRDI